MQAWNTRGAHVENTVGAIRARVPRVKAPLLLARLTASAVLAATVPPVPLKTLSINYLLPLAARDLVEEQGDGIEGLWKKIRHRVQQYAG
ncbi:hypothetical protein K7X08_008616 [Anisodus acutangulus]|uniref:Uncharacterized protein n=1 Tax=Anisodus acutangulus TaxID=402998 RepID=A0A9Q1RQ18_9SOLA|nr:hypothetical protein K7X08_008616 [Anisodus acutangulus]